MSQTKKIGKSKSGPEINAWGQEDVCNQKPESVPALTRLSVIMLIPVSIWLLFSIIWVLTSAGVVAVGWWSPWNAMLANVPVAHWVINFVMLALSLVVFTVLIYWLFGLRRC